MDEEDGFSVKSALSTHSIQSGASFHSAGNRKHETARTAGSSANLPAIKPDSVNGRANTSSSSAASHQSAEVTTTASAKYRRPVKKEPKKLHEIDFVGTGTFQVSQQNLLHQRSIEPFKNSEAILSARGLHHRSKEVFVKDVQNSTSVISALMRREKVSGAKYKPSMALMTPHFQRALAFERLKQIDKAIEDYSVCIRIDPKCCAAYFNRSGMYKIKGDYELAIEDMNKAIAVEPANVEYRVQRSLLYRLNGTYVEAVKETMLSRALKHQPSLALNLEDGDLKFDSDMLYAAKLLDDPIISVLQIEPEKRKEHTLEPIIDFLRGLKVFSDFGNRAGLLRVAKNIQLVTFPSRKFIFREGEPGHHFYIVLEGEVSIVKMKKRRDDDLEEMFDTVWKCYRGQSFGETALESVGGLRTAGAVVTQNAKLMVLHADQFKAILHSFKTVLTEEVRMILRSTLLFEDWSDADIDFLASRAIVRNYGSNTEIQKSGEKVNCLSMIKSGIVKLIKAMPMPDTTMPQVLSADGTLKDQVEETPGLWVLEKNWRHRLENASIAAEKLENGGVARHSNAEMVEFTVGVLGSGQVFGELAVLDSDTLSPVSAISSTAVEIYCFDINTMSEVQCHAHAKTMNILTESLTLHDPPVDKIAYYFRAKYNWEVRKNNLMKRLK
eukprot:gene17371-19795_t